MVAPSVAGFSADVSSPGSGRWSRGAMVATIAAALLVVPVGAAAADPDGTTDATVSVSEGIALFDLPAGFTLSGQPGDVATETVPFTYTVITNSSVGYHVTVQAESAVMVGTNGNVDTIDITRLGARDNTPTPATDYSAVSSQSAVTVHTQDTRSAIDGDSLATGYVMEIPAVNADSYTVTLDYVAAVNS